MNIPKTLYLYWGGSLSWLRYLTVVSFKKHNPGWRIRVYYPTQPTSGNRWHTNEQTTAYTGESWFNDLAKFAELVPFDMSVVGMSNDMPEVHKSDIFRLWALHEYGGAYSDFDILYTKPMPALKGLTYCFIPNGHYAIGLLAAEKGDRTMRALLGATRSVDGNKYQSYGSTMWARVLDEPPEGWNIPRNLVYSCDWQDAESLFTRTSKLPEEAIGIHWYGGSMDKWESEPLPESTISSIVKEYA